MRWYVEATKIGAHTPPATLVVDAEAWPRALQAARAIRGESGPITDFTIELLEDGCRAIEPHGLLAYRVTTAPDDTPRGEVRGPSVVPPRPAPSNPEASPAPSAPAVPSAVASSPASVPSVPSVPSAPVAAGAAPVAAPPSAPAALDPPPPPAEPALPTAVVVFERSQLPTADSPLHYRELAFALPADTTEEVAERVIFAELARLQEDMAALPSGKLINLAAFDRVFTGRPSVLPIATLTWKDWRTDPVVDFPLRRGTPAAPMPLSFPPPPSAMAMAESARISGLPPAAVPAEAAPPSVPQPAPSARGVTPDATLRIPLDPPMSERGDAPLPADRHLDSLDLPKAESASHPVVTELPEPSDPALPHDTLPPGPPPPSESNPAAAAAPPSEPSPSSDGLADIPAVDARDSQREPRSFGSIASSRSSIPRMVFARKRGDELLSVLFEAMYDLAFLRDAVEGADFCVGLALEQIPAIRGFVHLYDMDRREFVVVAGRGNDAAQRLLARTTDQDARFHSVMRQAGATVDGEAVLAPIVHAGRYIGILELDGSLDHQPFGEAEGHALVYIARQYAEFVAQRGVVIDAQRVSERPTSRRE
jgi:hypothetical protein